MALHSSLKRHFGRITGKDRYSFIEKLTVIDTEALQNGNASLSVFTNKNGGIIDDTMITKHGTFNSLYVMKSFNRGSFVCR